MGPILKHLFKTIPTEVKTHPIFTSTLLLWLLTIPFKNSIYQVSLFLISIIAITDIIKFKDYKTVKSLINRDKLLSIGIALLLVSMTLSSYFGLNPSNSFEVQMKFFYKYILLAFALQYLFAKRYFSLKILTSFIVFSLSIHIINGLYQSITSYDLFYNYGLHHQALSGAFQNRNIYGLFMLISSCILSILVSRRELKQWLPMTGILLAASIYCLIFSYSRASWLSYAAFYLILFFNSSRQHRLLAGTIPVMIAIVLFSTSESLLERLNQLLVGFDSGRIDIWLWAAAAFKQNWLLGYGLETMALIDGAPNYQFVHNSILEIAISLGFIGLCAYGIIASRILITAFQFTPRLFAMGIALFIVSLFDHSILDGKRFIPILMLYATYIMMFSYQKHEKTV